MVHLGCFTQFSFVFLTSMLVVTSAALAGPGVKVTGTVGINVIAPTNTINVMAMAGDNAPVVHAEEMAVTITREDRIDAATQTHNVDYTVFY